ncbi:MAG: hypothetical protein IJ312_03175 [Treponema sp.]|nr:hypothetical protein [Treponema sp.]
MEYVPLEERIMTECKDQSKEYLIRKGTNGLLGIFKALSVKSAKDMENYLLLGEKSSSMDLLLCIIPLVLKNGKVFDTEKAIVAIQKVSSNISNFDLCNCLILFSYIFDLFYGTTIEDAIDNINSLSEECSKRLGKAVNITLNKNNISSFESDFTSLMALSDFISSENYLGTSYTYANETSKAISFFIKSITRELTNENIEIEDKYGKIIQGFLLSI